MLFVQIQQVLFVITTTLYQHFHCVLVMSSLQVNKSEKEFAPGNLNTSILWVIFFYMDLVAKKCMRALVSCPDPALS